MRPHKLFPAPMRRSNLQLWLPVLAIAAVAIGFSWPEISRGFVSPSHPIAVVIDGDTIELAGERIRLHGIDAPELTQTCEIDRKPYPCGAEAAAHLRRVVARGSVTCAERTRDRWQRSVAVCRLPDGTDLGRQMVRDGHAVAFVRYSTDYENDEGYARSARVGLWRGRFVVPWEWRAKQR